MDERVDGAGVGVDSRQPAPRLPKEVTGLNRELVARGWLSPAARRLPLRCGQGVKGGGEVGHLGPAADAGHGLRVEEHVREDPPLEASVGVPLRPDSHDSVLLPV